MPQELSGMIKPFPGAKVYWSAFATDYDVIGCDGIYIKRVELTWYGAIIALVLGLFDKLFK